MVGTLCCHVPPVTSGPGGYGAVPLCFVVLEGGVATVGRLVVVMIGPGTVTTAAGRVVVVVFGWADGSVNRSGDIML